MKEPPHDPSEEADAEASRWWEVEVGANERADEGSFVLGFLAGLVGGIVILVLVLRKGKPNTRSGAWFGFGLQAFVLVYLGLASAR